MSKRKELTPLQKRAVGALKQYEGIAFPEELAYTMHVRREKVIDVLRELEAAGVVVQKGGYWKLLPEYLTEAEEKEES